MKKKKKGERERYLKNRFNQINHPVKKKIKKIKRTPISKLPEKRERRG